MGGKAGLAACEIGKREINGLAMRQRREALRTTLDRMIDDALVRRAATRNHVTVNAEEVDEFIQRVAQVQAELAQLRAACARTKTDCRALAAAGLHHVRVEGALDQKLDVLLGKNFAV